MRGPGVDSLQWGDFNNHPIIYMPSRFLSRNLARGISFRCGCFGLTTARPGTVTGIEDVVATGHATTDLRGDAGGRP